MQQPAKHFSHPLSRLYWILNLVELMSWCYIYSSKREDICVFSNDAPNHPHRSPEPRSFQKKNFIPRFPRIYISIYIYMYSTLLTPYQCVCVCDQGEVADKLCPVRQKLCRAVCKRGPWGGVGGGRDLERWVGESGEAGSLSPMSWFKCRGVPPHWVREKEGEYDDRGWLGLILRSLSRSFPSSNSYAIIVSPLLSTSILLNKVQKVCNYNRIVF